MRNVLVVEDSPTMRALMVAALEGLEFPMRIVEARSGFEALAQLPREEFDLILTDINMPDVNGLELVSFVRGMSDHRATPLVIVSTESSDRDREKGLALGADAYLVKPFPPAALQRVARELLAKPTPE